MTLEEIKQGNKLIVEYVGYPVREFTSITGRKFNQYCALPRPMVTLEVGYETQLLFHKDWNWLMPIVEMINSLGKEFSFAIFKNYVSCTVEKGGKFYKDFSFSHAEYITSEQNAITAVYKLVVKFIEWHNVKVKEELKTNE